MSKLDGHSAITHQTVRANKDLVALLTKSLDEGWTTKEEYKDIEFLKSKQ